VVGDVGGDAGVDHDRAVRVEAHRLDGTVAA
jgi:hypothetical protein